MRGTRSSNPDLLFITSPERIGRSYQRRMSSTEMTRLALSTLLDTSVLTEDEQVTIDESRASLPRSFGSGAAYSRFTTPKATADTPKPEPTPSALPLHVPGITPETPTPIGGVNADI